MNIVKARPLSKDQPVEQQGATLVCPRHLFATVEPINKKAFLYLDLDQLKQYGGSWGTKDETVVEPSGLQH
jgi:hypothetical protein